MKYLASLLILTFSSTLLHAKTIVYSPDQQLTKINLRFIKAEWGDSDTIDLTTEDQRVQSVVCGFNPWYGEGRSRIEYKNQWNLLVAQFSLDHHACLMIHQFVYHAFEGVSREHPIDMEIDLESYKVTKITFPELSYFESPKNDLR